jgi:hypothetical protein
MGLVLIGELYDIVAPYLGCGGNVGEPHSVPPTPPSDPAVLVLFPAEESCRERAVPPAEEPVVLPEGFSPSELLAESEPLIPFSKRIKQLERFKGARIPQLPANKMPAVEDLARQLETVLRQHFTDQSVDKARPGWRHTAFSGRG